MNPKVFDFLRTGTSDSSGSGSRWSFREQESRVSLDIDETVAFLEDLKEESLSRQFPPFTVVDRAIDVWLDLKQKLIASGIGERIREPTVGVDSSGEILLSWRLDTGYLECEVLKAKSEVFHENLDTGLVEFEELEQVGTAEADWLSKRLVRNI